MKKYLLNAALFAAIAVPCGFSQEAQPTADQAASKTNDAKKDRELMQQIRKSLMADKSLSTDAHNVKVISNNGEVTLRGPVRSEDERKTVEAKAIEVAGAGHVNNQLEIK